MALDNEKPTGKNNPFSQPEHMQPNTDTPDLQIPYSYTLKQSTSMSATIALFIIAGIALLLFTRFDYGQATSRYYSDNEDFSLILPQSAMQKFAEAGTALALKPDYSQYLKPLYKLLKDNPQKDSLHYYLGVAYFEMDDAVNAVRSFRKVLRQPGTPLKDKAEYRLGLSLWQGENIQEARSIFQKISRQPRHSYREAAASILKERDFKE